jgi:NADH:ubiquinone oxidoreductase subunit H
MNSIYYDLQEIFFIVYSPCWTVLLALFVAGAIVLAAQRGLTAIWRQRRGVYIVPDDDIQS